MAPGSPSSKPGRGDGRTAPAAQPVPVNLALAKKSRDDNDGAEQAMNQPGEGWRRNGERGRQSQESESDPVGLRRRWAGMRPQLRRELINLKNFIFGSTAAIITNISLIVGLGSARASKGPIIGGLLTIALADNISDSLGIHLYKETEGLNQRLSLLSTVLNFLSRLVVSLSFIGIVLLFTTSQSIVAAIIWGLLLLILLSYLISLSNKENSLKEIFKHILVAIVVIVLSRWAGGLIAKHF
jgi:VIT1/CCC1 family predicted Fe2+/Mn2+ transporter